jgi:hypothetical protein
MSINSQTPKYMRDLHSFIESIPFGDIDITVKRVDRKTAAINTVALETLRYVSNEEALHDLDKLVRNLLEARFSGDAHIKLKMKEGQISLVGVFNKKETKY